MALINPTRVLFSPRAPMRARVNIANNNAQRPPSASGRHIQQWR